jgi:hypothetical protein
MYSNHKRVFAVGAVRPIEAENLFSEGDLARRQNWEIAIYLHQIW